MNKLLLIITFGLVLCSTSLLNAGVIVRLTDLPVGCSEDSLRKTSFTPEYLKVKSLTALRKAICDYHRSEFWQGEALGVGVSDLSFDNAKAEVEHNKKIIANLQKAQTMGLKSAAQSFAALLEGIMHCRQGLLQNQMFLKSDKVHLHRAAFCSSRRKVYSNFRDVNWQTFDVIYSQEDFIKGYCKNTDGDLPENSPLSKEDCKELMPKVANTKDIHRFGENKLIELMSQCYDAGGILSTDPKDGWDTKCGEFSPVSFTQKETIVNRAVKNAVSYYFGGSGPAYRMIKNKQDMTEGVAKKADITINEVLKPKFDALKENLRVLNDSYETGRDKVNETVLSYMEVYSRIKAVRVKLELWKSGLLKTVVDEEDQKPLLDNAVSNLITSEPKFEEDLKRIEAFKKNLELLRQRKKLDEEATITLCRVLYCEMDPLSDIEGASLNDICEDSDIKGANPLCKLYLENKSGNFLDSSAIDPVIDETDGTTVSQLCAGLDKNYINRKTVLSARDYRKCTKTQ